MNLGRIAVYSSLCYILASSESCAPPVFRKEKPHEPEKAVYPDNPPAISSASNLNNNIGHKKYAVLLPGSFNGSDTKDNLSELIQGLAPSPYDTLKIIIFSNASDSSAANNQKQESIVSAYLNEQRSNQPNAYNFQWDIKAMQVIYRDFAGKTISCFIDFLIGDSSSVHSFYTLGHGLTYAGGFETFISGPGMADFERVYVPWEEYFRNQKWLDLSCGSTWPVIDPFSKKLEMPVPEDYDGLGRYWRELHLYIRQGLEIKQKMKCAFEAGKNTERGSQAKPQ